MNKRTGPGQILSDNHSARGNSFLYWLLKLSAVLLIAPVLFFLVLAGLAVADQSVLSTVPDHIPRSGELLSRVEASEKWQPAAQVSSKVVFEISGMVAHVTLSQKFKNLRSEWVEARYQFPLPDTAAVKRMDMVVGERQIRGRIKEKRQAEKIYKRARAAGKKAGLVSQQRPNMFTSRVANIGPGEVIVVEIVYVQQVTYEAGQFSLRFPMTITPRYIPGTPLDVAGGEAYSLSPGSGWATPTHSVPDASAITPYANYTEDHQNKPLNPVELIGKLDMGMPLDQISSPSHALALTRQGQRYRFALQSNRVSMNRDFVLQWRAQTGHEPRAAVFREKTGDSEYALLMIVPPSSSTILPLARRVIFVIDTSGSMAGTSIEQAKSSLISAIGQLRVGEQFNIIEFNSSTHALFDVPAGVSADTKKRARHFVRSLQANGGTEMHGALELAMSQAVSLDTLHSNNKIQQIVFITDGAVGNEAELFKFIESRLGHTRLFTVGIGSAPNSWFMRKAAVLGRGTHVHIDAGSEVADETRNLFEKMSRPLSTGLSVAWPSIQGQDVATESYPEMLPDLYAGEPAIVAVRVNTALNGEILIGGELEESSWQQSISLPPLTDSNDNQKGVASLWARKKIESLLDQKRAGVAETEIRTSVVEIALQHQLLSPYTSFVAVEELLSRPASASLKPGAIANASPAGQSPQHYAYPRTATRSVRSLVLACLLLLGAGIFFMARRQSRGRYNI